MGEILEALRSADIASVVVFSLAEIPKRPTTVQVIEATPSASTSYKDDSSSATASVTIRNPSEHKDIVSGKEQ